MRYLFCLAIGALAMGVSAAPAQSVGELPRAGAPRPLRLVASNGEPLKGSPSDVAWERRGGGVFFTLERGGTRNIWRAFPDPQDISRYPAWRALPVTDLRAPQYAAQPCPLPGDRAIVCVSNALANAPSRVAQIVRYDIINADFRALSDGVRFYQSPQVSPDGTRVAFEGGSGSDLRAFIADASNPQKRVMPNVDRVADQMRRPVWLDNSTLMIEGVAPQSRGLYRVPTDGTRTPTVIVGGGGEANTLGESGIVFSAKTSKNAPTNLYIVARDGSGLRALSDTKGARRPAVSPDGQTLAYDAPLSGAPLSGAPLSGVPQDTRRALWIVPLLRVENRVSMRKANRNFRLVAADAPEYDGPSVGLSSVRAFDGAIAIIGNVRGATDSNITLEVGQGGKPRRWEILPVSFPLDSPLLDAQGDRVLATWNPPPRERGDWTLRLSLRGLGGGAQSLLRVRLPLPAPPPSQAPLPPLVAPPGDATPRTSNSATEPLPRATPLPELPDVMPVRGAFLPLPALPPLPSVVPNPDNDLPDFPTIQSPDSPSDIAVVPPPTTAPFPINVPVNAPTTAGVEIVPIDPSLFQMPAILPPQNSPQKMPVASEPNAADGDYGDVPDVPAGTPLVAQFNVSGTPARMAPREKVKLTLWAINRGTTNWETGGSGENRVRLVARWVDFSTGTRRQWNFFWLREAVAPGERTKWDFDVSAPTRPGKYKLIYGLVRLPASGEYKAPVYSASQEEWPAEFGAIAFAVEVAPK